MANRRVPFFFIKFMASLRAGKSRDAHLSRRQIATALLIAAISVVLLVLILSTRVTFLPAAPAEATLVEGQASPVTILAPERITFASSRQTTHAQEQAAELVPEIYDPPNAETAREQVRLAGRVLDFLDTVRADPYSDDKEKTRWITSIPGVTVPSQVVSRTVTLEPTAYRQVISETLYVLDQAMREEIREKNLEEARNKLSTRVSLVLSAEQAELVTQWATSFLVPNSFYNAARTEAARQRARESVGIVYRTIEKGQAVVRAGEVVTPDTTEVLKQLGLLQPQSNYQDAAAAVVFSMLMVLIGALYIGRFRPSLFRQPRVLMLLALIVLSAALGAKIVIPGRSIIPYLFPFAAAAMLAAALLDAAIGMGVALIVGMVVGFVSRGSIDLAMFALVGGAVAVLTLRELERLTSFIVTGLYVALANVGLVLLFRLLARDQDVASLTQITFAAIGSGALTGLIALGSQFVLGKLGGLTTALELIELARPTHPLLQKLLREAPGTYHHSLIIGNLAEQAAERIGADALLARVGAYYHDVGKTLNPQFYVENQSEGINIHDTLDPRTSAAILHQHVLDGLALTKRYGVSDRVRDFVPQHHGTTVASYFYRKAVAQANGHPVSEEDFRYPGPKPQTREAAIMMLADGVEATTRAEKPATIEELRAIITRIVDQRVRDGQLDDVDITLQDIENIKQAFLEVLQGLYHPRVRYPLPPNAEDPKVKSPALLPQNGD